MHSGLRVRDRRLRGALGRLPDEDRAGLGDALDPRGRVDEVARDHALALGADRHGRLARQDSRARPQAGVEVGDRGDQVERRANGTLGVVLVGDRRAPDGHDGVADELLDGAAVELDQTTAGVEIAREELARVLGVAVFGSRCETDQIREQDGDQPALRLRCGGRLLGRR